MADGTDVGNNRPTMRDVVDLVNETRKELNDSIGTLAAKFDAFVTSNEHRLTVLEMHQATQAADLSGVVERLNKHGEYIGDIRDRQKRDEAATSALENARRARWTLREKVFAAACSVLVATGAILVLFIH